MWSHDCILTSAWSYSCILNMIFKATIKQDSRLKTILLLYMDRTHVKCGSNASLVVLKWNRPWSSLKCTQSLYFHLFSHHVFAVRQQSMHFSFLCKPYFMRRNCIWGYDSVLEGSYLTVSLWRKPEQAEHASVTFRQYPPEFRGEQAIITAGMWLGSAGIWTGERVSKPPRWSKKAGCIY